MEALRDQAVELKADQKKMKFLLVDDKEVITELLASLVASMGYEYVCAADGQQAYERICRENFEIIITDLMMPNMNGTELINKVREHSQNTIIIVITGYATVEKAISVMKNGAYDFITKPFHLNEIKAIINKAVDYYHLREKNRKYSEEMKIAQSLRNRMLFHPDQQIAGLKVGIDSFFVDELGGDIYNIIPVDAENVFCYIGDVSSRGINASLLSTIVHSIINETLKVTSSPGEVLKRVNASLHSYLGGDSAHFVTLLTMKLNLITNKLVYARAGHSSPIIMRDKTVLNFPKTDCVFLGMFDDVIYSEHDLPLQKDDLLVLFTDGLIETRNQSGEMFSRARVEECLKDNSHLSCKALAKKLGQESIKFNEKGIVKDDMSILVIAVTGEKAEEIVPMEESSIRIVELEIASVLKYRKGVLSKILTMGNEIGMSNDRLHNLKLVLDEVMINAIEHGNKLDSGKKVHVTCEYCKEYLKMKIRDQGDGFVPDQVPKENDNFGMRGRGLMLMREFADDVVYNEKGNEVSIAYHLGGKR